MSPDEPHRYSIVFDKRDESLESAWSTDADEIMAVDAEIRELAEASEAIRSPERHVYTLS